VKKCCCIDYWINPEKITNKTIESVQFYYDIGEVKSTSTLTRDQKHHNIKTLKKIKLN
jgi:hypothetical protein